jgi:hypothetical protein
MILGTFMLLGAVEAVAVETMSLLDLLHLEGLLFVRRCRGSCVDSGARGLLISDLFIGNLPGEELSCSGGFGSGYISWGSLSGRSFSGGLLAFATFATFTLATFTLVTFPFTALATVALSALGFTSGKHLISISDIPCGGGLGRWCISWSNGGISGGSATLLTLTTPSLTTSAFTTLATTALSAPRLTCRKHLIVGFEVSCGGGFSSCISWSGGGISGRSNTLTLTLTAFSFTASPFTALATTTPSALGLASRKLGGGGIMRWSGWFLSDLGVKALVAGFMMMSFMFVVRMHGGGRSRGYSGGRFSFSNIIFLDVHIVHTGVEFGDVAVVALSKVIGVFRGHSQDRCPVDKGGNNSESGACGRHV